MITIISLAAVAVTTGAVALFRAVKRVKAAKSGEVKKAFGKSAKAQANNKIAEKRDWVTAAIAAVSTAASVIAALLVSLSGGLLTAMIASVVGLVAILISNLVSIVVSVRRAFEPLPQFFSKGA